MSANERTTDAATRRNQFVDVAVDARVAERDRLLTYALPQQLSGQIAGRQLVWVPLRDRLRLGLVVRVHEQPPPFDVRPVHAPVEPAFRLSPAQWTLADWLSRETFCSLYDAAALFFPPGVAQRAVEYLHLRDGLDLATLTLTPAQRALVDLLAERGDLTIEAARQALGRRLSSVIARLVAEGVIERAARVQSRPTAAATRRLVRVPTDYDPAELAHAPAQRRAWETVRRRVLLTGGDAVPWEDVANRPGVTPRALLALRDRGAIVVEAVDVPAEGAIPARHGPGGGGVRLTPEQAAVWRAVLDGLRSGGQAEFLLHGVTGSGKTEIYLRAAAWCLRHGKQVIVLVPEIALASQVVDRFAERFPGRVGVLHSSLAPGARSRMWSAVAAGHVPIVVGPRSALFAPMDDIGLIVVDEEHEPAYKQDSPPRYHAREVARQLAGLHGATLILGSATPDVTTYYAATRGRSMLLTLPRRVGPAIIAADGRRAQPELALPGVTIVDMRQELQRGNTHIFSLALQERLEQTLRAGEQAILFLNRRGTSTLVQCRACGYVERCPFCDIPLVYHADRGRLLCHRCGHRQFPASACPACGRDTIGYYGTGTQRVAREVERRFPEARVARWDQDVLRGGVGYRQLIDRVLRHDVDIIVGTQMVAKGLDFPLVTTTGVINADTLLYLPDVRAAERTFQLLTQVAGRAGRRSAGAQVIIQSYTTDHYVIQAAARHDYAAFFREELAYRRYHGYPPFSRLIRLVYRHSDPVTCEATAGDVALRLAREAYRLSLTRVDILGPTPAFTAKVRGHYQWQIIVRGDDAHALMEQVRLDPGWMIDVDPMSLL